jgi:hypothetical protein
MRQFQILDLGIGPTAKTDSAETCLSISAVAVAGPASLRFADQLVELITEVVSADIAG